MAPADIPATNIDINNGVETIDAIIGENSILTAAVSPDNHTQGEVEWTSSQDDIVSVSNTGPTNATFTARAIGSATITAMVGGEMDSLTINVVVPATNITIDQGESLVTNRGSTATLSATVLPTNHTQVEVKWVSSSDEIVSVISTGSNIATFTAEAAGSATITARVGDETDSITIDVVIPATNITIDQGESLITNRGSTGTLSAMVLPTDHTDGAIVWSSSDSGIVTIDSNSGYYQGVAEGSTTITARVGSEADTITVLVSFNYMDDTNRVDDDGNGLIEIFSLIMLHNMRNNLAGTSYKTNSSGGGNSNGCPSGVCEGYELVQNLSFDTDGDGTWSGSAGSYTLDEKDSNAVYFNVFEGGWLPVGDGSDPFTAIFDGGGFTITGLATSSSNGTYFGMFGVISNAQIHNLGLVSNLADYTGSEDNGAIGGLVGLQAGSGIISNCYATGAANGGSGGDNIGGLVGFQTDSANIVASYATGAANGGDNSDSVGGLVGEQDDSANIVASYATGAANGGGHSDFIGGLVGEQNDSANIVASYATGAANGGGANDRIGGLVGGQRDSASIVASYATGDVNGEDHNDRVGGLVGEQDDSANIVASYATGAANGGSGRNNIGGLVGFQNSSSFIVTASYGFGRGGDPDGDPPVENASQLTLSNAGTNADGDFIWNDAAFDTMGAWDFGDSTTAPRLFFNDYDGTNDMFGCSGTPTILIPNCGSLIPGQ